MILSRVTSSPEVSLASNLHRDTVLLSSLRQASKDTEVGPRRQHWKKLCSEVKAADVIGPVERGERMIAKKGASSVVEGSNLISVKDRYHNKTRNRDDTRTFHVLHQPPEILEASHELLLRTSSVRRVRCGILSRPSESQTTCKSRIAGVAERCAGLSAERADCLT